MVRLSSVATLAAALAGGRASWESSWEVRGEVAASVGLGAELHLDGTAAVKEQGHMRELVQRRPRSGVRRGRGMRRGCHRRRGLFFFCILFITYNSHHKS